MADPEIRVSVTASTQAATAQMEDFGARAKAAMEAYNAAAAKSKSTSEALGKAFDEAMASGLSFTEAMERATASVSGYATATERTVAAQTHVVPQFAAASGALRELEGNFDHNIRAAERFLSTTLGLGPILQAAFPVVGALAMGGVLVDIGEKLGKFASDAAALGRELGGGWLDGAVAQVTGLAKEIKQTDDEMLKLAGDRDRLQGRQNTQDVEQAQLQTQIDTYKKLTAGLGPENAKNAQAYARAAAEAQAAGQRAADALHAEQLQKQIDALEKIKQLHVESYEAIEKEINSQFEQDRVGSVGIEKLRKDQELANSQYQDALKQQMVLIQEKNNLLLKGQVAEEREDRAAGRGVGKPNEVHKLVAQEGLDDAREKLQQLKADTRDVEENFQKTIDGPFKAIANSEELIHKNAEANARAYRERAQAAEDAAQASIREAEAQHNIAIAQINAAEAQGSLTRAGADHAKAAADAELYRQKLEALQKQLDQLIVASEQYKRVLREGEQVKGQQQVSQISDQSKTAQDLAAPFIKATDSINQVWLSMQNKLIFGTRHIAREFANMGVSMLESVAASFEKMLVKQLQYEIQAVIAHQVAKRTQTAADQEAAAQADTLNRQSALKEEFIHAKVAATGAFKGVMSHVPPPLNAILAPVAAAAAFTGTLAVGAFEKGGIIPNTGLALVHEGEGVMPRNLTNLLSSVANNYSTHSSSVALSHTSNFNGITERNFRDMARRNGEAVFDAAHSAVRGGRRRIG